MRTSYDDIKKHLDAVERRVGQDRGTVSPTSPMELAEGEGGLHAVRVLRGSLAISDSLESFDELARRYQAASEAELAGAHAEGDPEGIARHEGFRDVCRALIGALELA